MIQKILWYKFDDIVLLCYKDQFEFFSWTIKHHLLKADTERTNKALYWARAQTTTWRDLP